MTNKDIPAWAMEPFDTFIHDIERLTVHTIVASLGGAFIITDQELAMQRLSQMATISNNLITDDIKTRIVKSAQSEEVVDIIYQQALTALWGILESFIYDLFVTWLENDSQVLQNDIFARTKVSLAQYMMMSDEEKRQYILDSVKQDTKSSLKHGINMFEVLLEPLGLKGNIDEEVKKKLREFSNTRNVIVHKRGIVDRRMVEACPWLDLSVGHKIKITPLLYYEYVGAAITYIKDINTRVKNYF
jgi:hypothetical protein